MTGADRINLIRAHDAMCEGDSMVARRFLAAVKDIAIRDEIDDLIRAGHYDDATHRLHLFINPKFPSVSDCAAHVGDPNQFRTKQGSLL